MTTAHKFTLGQRVRCTVTNYEGILINRIEHLNGCVQYCVKPQVDPEKPHERPDGYYIDDEQLELVDQGILDPPTVHELQEILAEGDEPVVMGVDPASGPDEPKRAQAGGGPSYREGALPR